MSIDWTKRFQKIEAAKNGKIIQERIWKRIDSMEASGCFSQTYRVQLFNQLVDYISKGRRVR